MKGCGSCKGIGAFVIGALVWMNATYSWFDWGTFAGIALMLIGIGYLICSSCCEPTAKSPAKKRKK